MKLPKTAWKPGQSGNPNGRPKKGYSITATMKRMLKAKPKLKRALATKVLEKALLGDIAAQKLIWQYMDGMPKQVTKLEGDENRPLGVVILPQLKNEETSSLEITPRSANGSPNKD